MDDVSGRTSGKPKEGGRDLARERHRQSRALAERYNAEGRREDLDEAVRLARQAVSAAPRNSPDRAEYLAGLAKTLRGCHALTGDAAVLAEVIDRFGEAAAAAAADRAEQGRHLSDLAGALRERYRRTADAGSLASSLEAGRRAVAMVPPGHDARAMCLGHLAFALRSEFERTGDVTVLEEAARATREAVAESAGSAGITHGLMLMALCSVQFVRGQFASDRAALSEAIDAGRQAMRELPAASPHQAQATGALIDALRTYSRHGGGPEALDEALGLCRRLEAATPAASADRGWVLYSLGDCLWDKFAQTGDRGCLTEAERALLEASAVPSDRRTRALIMPALGRVWRRRAHLTNDRGALDHAIAALREAAAGGPDGSVGQGADLARLGDALLERYRVGGDPEDLEEAIQVLRQAVAVIPTGSADQCVALCYLSQALLKHGQRAGDRAVLGEAVTAARQAVAGMPDGYADAGLLLSTLGNALQYLSMGPGGLDVRDEAIEVLSQAVAATPEGHPDHPTRVSALAGASLVRARLTDLDDAPGLPDDATRLARRALARMPAEHSDRPLLLLALAAALRQRSHDSAGPAALDEAITLTRQAAAAIPAAHVQHANTLIQLAQALDERFRLTGDPADRDEAITAVRGALAATPAGHGERSMLLQQLSLLLGATDEALSTAREAVAAAPPGSALWEQAMHGLAVLLGARLDEIETRGLRPHGSPASPEGGASRSRPVEAEVRIRDEAVAVNRALASSPAVSPVGRMLASLSVGGMILGVDDRAAADAFSAAVELLPQVAARALRRAEAEGQLAQYASVASEAAAGLVRAGDPERAVAVLEMGRGVLLSRVLESRGDLTGLREQAPLLADRFDYLCVSLSDGAAAFPQNRFEWLKSRLSGGYGTAAEEAASLEDARAMRERHQHAAELQDLIASIRSLPGRESFLIPSAAAELVRQAGEGPLAFVYASRLGCGALAVTASGVQAISLPLSQAETVQLILDYHQALSAALDPEESGQAAEAQITTILGRLWDNVTGPVLEAVGLTRTPAQDEPWPRIWWIPVGPLALLPLHAAGHHHADSGKPAARTVMDRAVSSYAPTIRALGHAREQRARNRSSARPPSGLAIAMAVTPGQSELPATEWEAVEFKQRIPGARILRNEQATRDAVLTGLQRASWAHFGCHAEARPDDPSASRLLVSDYEENPLTVLDISRLHLPSAELAYLSACTTAAPGTRIPDEAIHLASAFLLAGYPQVIATLGPVRDQVSEDIAWDVYVRLSSGKDRAPDATGAARALHAATRRQRGLHIGMPSLWSLHIHAGA